MCKPGLAIVGPTTMAHTHRMGVQQLAGSSATAVTVTAEQHNSLMSLISERWFHRGAAEPHPVLTGVVPTGHEESTV